MAAPACSSISSSTQNYNNVTASSSSSSSSSNPITLLFQKNHKMALFALDYHRTSSAPCHRAFKQSALPLSTWYRTQPETAPLGNYQNPDKAYRELLNARNALGDMSSHVLSQTKLDPEDYSLKDYSKKYKELLALEMAYFSNAGVALEKSGKILNHFSETGKAIQQKNIGKISNRFQAILQSDDLRRAYRETIEGNKILNDLIAFMIEDPDQSSGYSADIGNLIQLTKTIRVENRANLLKALNQKNLGLVTIFTSALGANLFEFAEEILQHAPAQLSFPSASQLSEAIHKNCPATLVTLLIRKTDPIFTSLLALDSLEAVLHMIAILLPRAIEQQFPEEVLQELLKKAENVEFFGKKGITALFAYIVRTFSQEDAELLTKMINAVPLPSDSSSSYI